MKCITEKTREYSKENAFIGEKLDPLWIFKTSISGLQEPIREKSTSQPPQDDS